MGWWPQQHPVPRERGCKDTIVGIKTNPALVMVKN
jgi:hypothetical protein